jgi:hypothetical protein
MACCRCKSNNVCKKVRKKFFSFFIHLISSNCCKGNLKYSFLPCVFSTDLVIVCVCMFEFFLAGLSEYQKLICYLLSKCYCFFDISICPPETTIFVRGLSLFVYYCLCLSGRDHITNHGRYSSVVLVSTFQHTRLFWVLVG